MKKNYWYCFLAFLLGIFTPSVTDASTLNWRFALFVLLLVGFIFLFLITGFIKSRKRFKIPTKCSDILLAKHSITINRRDSFGVARINAHTSEIEVSKKFLSYPEYFQYFIVRQLLEFKILEERGIVFFDAISTADLVALSHTKAKYSFSYMEFLDNYISVVQNPYNYLSSQKRIKFFIDRLKEE
jgi:hypothetical protein